MKVQESNNHTIIFVHIRRTGGTTLNIILINNFGIDNFFCTTGENKGRPEDYVASISQTEKIKIIEGHFAYGFHKYFDNYKYITILRNPVERSISYYYFIRQQRWHWLHKMADSLSLRAFVSIMPANEQSTAIAGSLDKIDPKTISSPISPQSLLNHITLQQAKKHLDNMTFGLTERFHESLDIFQHELGLNSSGYGIYNEARNRPFIEEIEADTLDFIRNRNLIDVKLYEYAQALFDKRLKKAN